MSKCAPAEDISSRSIKWSEPLEGGGRGKNVAGELAKWSAGD